MHRCKPLAVGTLVAISTLLMAPTAAGATTRDIVQTGSSQLLHPPAIKELFSPVLPCNPDTTVGQEGCAERMVLADDKQLTRDIEVIFQMLRTASARRDFVAAQTSWINYRTKDCASQSDIYQGGTEQPVVYGDCLANDDVSRRLDLKSFYDGLSQGLGSKAPAFS
jgi:uncharacterized protein YecT (DUF1311 family)